MKKILALFFAASAWLVQTGGSTVPGPTKKDPAMAPRGIDFEDPFPHRFVSWTQEKSQSFLGGVRSRRQHRSGTRSLRLYTHVQKDSWAGLGIYPTDLSMDACPLDGTSATLLTIWVYSTTWMNIGLEIGFAEGGKAEDREAWKSRPQTVLQARTWVQLRYPLSEFAEDPDHPYCVPECRQKGSSRMELGCVEGFYFLVGPSESVLDLYIDDIRFE